MNCFSERKVCRILLVLVLCLSMVFCMGIPVNAENNAEPEVTAISFSEVYRYENALDNGYDVSADFEWLTDTNGQKYKCYYCYEFRQGDKMAVTYNDGSTKEFVFTEDTFARRANDTVCTFDQWWGYFKAADGAIIRDEITITSDQEKEHWGLGKHKLRAEYKGAVCDIDVTVYHDLASTTWEWINHRGTVVLFNGKADYETTWTGKKITPAISVKTAGNGTLKEGRDYTKPVLGNNVDMGYCIVKMDGRGNFCGSVIYIGDYEWDDQDYYYPRFGIRPLGTSLTKVYGIKKGLKVSWKKQARKMSKNRITGYQIQISTDKKFPKKGQGRKSYTIKGYKNVSKKITKLKSGKKYYVRIRTYYTTRKAGTIYSKWSKVKAVKTR